MTRSLTDDELVAWIAKFTKEHSYAPSVREVSCALGINLSSTHVVLRALREQGEVEWNEGETRTLRVTNAERT